MVDRRIVPDLRWIAAALPDLRHRRLLRARCPTANTSAATTATSSDSDHYNGLAVDIVPLERRAPTATPAGRAITRLAHWAEPRQNEPRPPFRWVGYDGDAGHGCGNHLHLSWNHAPGAQFQLAEWVEVFPVGSQSEPRRRRPRCTAAAATPPERRHLDRPTPAASRRAATDAHGADRDSHPLGCGADAPRRSHRLALALIGLALAAAGCGSSRRHDPGRLPRRRERLPRSALDAPPGEVKLGGERRSANAWPRTSGAATWRRSATAMVRPRPSSTPRRGPTRRAADLQLGYLLGAAERGAEETEGIHAELIRRLAAPPATAPATGRCRRSFERAYEEASKPADTADRTPAAAGTA